MTISKQSRIPVFTFVKTLADQLNTQGKTISLADLAATLNRFGFTTGRGTPYQIGGRGIAKVVSATYVYVESGLGLGDLGAAPVALAFKDQNGFYAYEK